MRGRRRACWLFAALFACASQGGGARDGGPTPAPSEARDPGFLLFPHDAELSSFVQSYPRAPDPEAALDRLFALDLARFEAGARERESQWPLARELLIEFYATLIREEPARATALAQRAAVQSAAEKGALCQEVLARAAADPVEVEFPLEDAEWLDLLWARYYASGDRAYVREIARPLEHALPAEDSRRRMREIAQSAPGTPEYAELQRILTANAAVFGLTTHAMVDPGVRAVLRELAREPGHVGGVSASIVRYVVTPRAPDWMRSSGDFTALVFLTNDFAGLARQLEQPSDPPLYPIANHARRGSVIDAVIWFSDCTIGPDGLCHLRADFVVNKPDGSVYGENHGAGFWVDRPPAAKGVVQMAEWTERLILEAHDPLGRYLIHATIRDEVGGHTLSITLPLFVEESP